MRRRFTMVSTLGPIRLIPWMRDTITAHWPGTRLAFTEYYHGGGADISGGVAEADVLGGLGREDVFLAEVWHVGFTDDRYIYAALSMFRDHDGAGGHFGDTSVQATASDDSVAAVYASADSGTPGTLVVVVINRATLPFTAALTVTDTARCAHAAVWQLTGAGAAPTHAAGITATATNAFRYTAPARSVSTLVLSP